MPKPIKSIKATKIVDAEMSGKKLSPKIIILMARIITDKIIHWAGDTISINNKKSIN